MKTKQLSIFLFLSILLNIKLNAQNQEKFDHDLWDQALLLNISSDGLVNYEGFMRDSSLLYAYFRQLSKNPPQKNWSREKQMAYWINAYNAYTIKLIIDSYPLESIKDLKAPWDKKFFKINQEWFSLNDLEHKILRKFKDPRIHFAINCASLSCPVVWHRAYTEDNLNQTLDRQASSFINDPKRNVITPDSVYISKIFLWYKRDFKEDHPKVIQFINRYANTKIHKQPIKYKEYDWGLNQAKKENSFVGD